MIFITIKCMTHTYLRLRRIFHSCLINMQSIVAVDFLFVCSCFGMAALIGLYVCLFCL